MTVTVGRAVTADEAVPEGLARIDVPAQRCMHIATNGSIDAIRDAWSEVWGRWPDGGPRAFAVDVEHWQMGPDGRPASADVYVGTSSNRVKARHRARLPRAHRRGAPLAGRAPDRRGDARAARARRRLLAVSLPSRLPRSERRIGDAMSAAAPAETAALRLRRTDDGVTSRSRRGVQVARGLHAGVQGALRRASASLAQTGERAHPTARPARTR